MAKARPVTIAGMNFKTQGAAKDYWRSRVASISVGHIFTGFDREFLSELVLMHHDCAQKLGCGVDHFYFARSAKSSTNCVHIKRLDGSSAELSFDRAINGNPKSSMKTLSDACRRAVGLQIAIAKSTVERSAPDGLLECEVTGKRLPRAMIRADHQPTFQNLLLMFIEKIDLDIKSPEIYEPADQDAFKMTYLRADLADVFRDMHERRGQIRLMTDVVNAVEAGKQRNRKLKNPLQLRLKTSPDDDFGQMSLGF